MRPIDTVLAKLQDPRRVNDGQWKAICPAHDDQHPSLQVTEGDDGTVLLKCFVCNANVRTICDKLGLDVRALFVTTDLLPPPKAKKSKAVQVFDTAKQAMAEMDSWGIGKNAGRWIYHDATGQPVMLIVRYNKPDGKKEFRPISRKGKGWAAVGMPEPRPLYRLPELLAAKRVFVCEGEKACDCAWKLGLVATTSAHGAQSPEKTDWSPLGNCDEVILVADNDDAGREFMDIVAKLLAVLPKPPKVIKRLFLPDLPPKGDIVEFVEARDAKTAEEIRAEIEALINAAPSAELGATKARPTLKSSMAKYVAELKGGTRKLISTGIRELDHALAGGVDRGEMVIFGARPSHGKSAVGLQLMHTWTLAGMNTLILSEEMSAVSLGKRALQYISETSEEYWEHSIDTLEEDIRLYAESHAECFVVETCKTAAAAAIEIERYAKEHAVEAVMVDYAQLLRGPGKTTYEQVSSMSMALKAAAKENNVVLLMLCQLGREVEKRDKKFIPRNSDIKESGQLEQDADVMMFGVWPHRLNSKNPPHDYQFFITKNRNRAIKSQIIQARFDPSRQRFSIPKPANYTDAFDQFNQDEVSQHEFGDF